MSCRLEQNSVSNNGQNAAPVFDNQLLTIQQLSEFLNVPIATVRDWVYKRLIPYVKVGRHVRFLSSDVEQWLDERKVLDGH